jgi:predicted Zn-dependent peptidase
MNHSITLMNNGLRVISREMPHMESVAVGVWIGVGGRYEHKRACGISHFLEHILFKGSRRRSAKEITRAIESVGGALNGFTTEEYTCYYAKVLHKHLPVACDVLFDMVRHPAIKKADVAKERGVIREEINMYLDTPQYHVSELFNQAVWKDHPLGRPLIGTPQSISATTEKELRAYHRHHYLPAAMVISAAGRLKHKEIVNQVKRLFPLNSVARAKFAFAPARNAQRRPSMILQRKPTEQTHLCIGVKGFCRDHPDKFALYLLSTILGENMSSRLFQQIREKHGLAYAIHSHTIYFRDTGAFIINAGIKNRKFSRAVRMILRELDRLAEQGIKKLELQQAKEYFRGQLSIALEKTSQNMLRIGENLLCSGLVLTKEEIFSKLASVTQADVQRVARSLFKNNRLSLAAIGPLKEKDEGIYSLLDFS